MSSIISAITNGAVNIGVFSWDAALSLYNLVTPKLPKGKVVPRGCPGEGGKWPEYVPPKEGDSRSACPALNALANHGILPHDGRNITFKDLTQGVRSTYNFAPTISFYVPNVSAQMLHKSYSKDSFDLEDLNLHNAIEHDASLTRDDFVLQPDQGKPALHLVKGLLAFATGKDADGTRILTTADLSRYSGARRTQAKDTNDQFSLDLSHKIFGSANSSTLLKTFGGKVPALEALLVEERLLDGWEPTERSRMGLTLAAFNSTAFAVEFGIPGDPVVLGNLVKEAETAQGSASASAAGVVGEEAGGDAAVGMSTAIETSTGGK